MTDTLIFSGKHVIELVVLIPALYIACSRYYNCPLVFEVENYPKANWLDIKNMESLLSAVEEIEAIEAPPTATESLYFNFSAEEKIML